ncbi:MAG: 4-hydroxybenzoyl-CoA reductase subunit alpha [Clostridia bacterium]|jgi:4-hydroxybenzoyl-CoA reductase subunit alpha|nr:4-hydroxybenzoyl-CoA reductase subunit alpha [Clostridia bacterium]MDH7572967.1 4-hydroxybenzoyl-CoA reductase subunit alpha [Clostridia bacterium]
MSDNYAVIGKSVPRVDAYDKVTGRAKYTADLKFSNMLVGKLLTSPYAHARILSIDTSQAEKLPGVRAVITAKDVPATKYGLSPARWDENVFCIDKVRYVGDKVAAVAAEDVETVYQALKLIKVEYEVLPAVFDPYEAIKEEAPQIFDEYPRNINVEIHHHFGDVEKAFKEAFYVRTDSFVGQRTYQSPLEPHASIAFWEGDKVTLYSATQSVHYLQYYLSRVFGLPLGKIRVLKTYVGGGFGGKLDPTGLDFAAVALAKITGRPVKMFFDRHEMFYNNRGRHKMFMEYTTGVTEEGKILGVHANLVIDGGAYTGLGIASAYYAGALLPVYYEFDNYKFDCVRVVTNLPPCGAQRGHGQPQPRFAFESHLTHIAEDLGMDPIEIRLVNARRPGTVTLNGLKVDSYALKEALEKARDISGWKDKKGKLPKGRGIGVGVGGFVSGAGYPIYRTNLPHAVAMIKVHDDGTAATVYTGAVDIGQGSDTVLCQMAAEAMGYRFEDIKIVAADTDLATHDFGAYASRQTLMAGWAVKRAGEEIKRKILETAAGMLGVSPEELDCREGVVFKKADPSVTKPFAEIARAYFVQHGQLVGRGSYRPPKLGGTQKGATVGTSPAYSAAVQVAEVEVDEETGEIKVVEAWDVHDSGFVVNPALLHGQVHGAFSMGLGETIWEEVLFDEKGRLLNGNLAEYRLPTALDMPPVTSELVESSDPNAPWGVKEVGEGATTPTLGCVANAIYDATGVRVRTLPITYEKLWRALKEKRAGKV